MDLLDCTIYDCEYDQYLQGVISNNKIFVRDDSGSLIPTKTEVCEHVDNGLVQFYVGSYDEAQPKMGNPKWGYFHLDSGEILIPPVFDDSSPYYGRTARVTKDGKCGHIDPSGKADLLWDDCYGFHNGLCAVKKNNLWGYINEDNKIVIDFMFSQVENFRNILRHFQSSNSKKPTMKPMWLAKIKKDKNYGYIDTDGEFIIQPEFEILDEFIETDNGDFAALVKKEGKYGFIAPWGHFITEPYFEDAKRFWEKGYAPVCKKGKWGFINTLGELVLPFQFDDVGDYVGEIGYENIYPVNKDGKWGIIDEHLDVYLPEIDNQFLMYNDTEIYLSDGHITIQWDLNMED